MSTGYLKQGKSVKAKDWEAEFRSVETVTGTLEQAVNSPCLVVEEHRLCIYLQKE